MLAFWLDYGLLGILWAIPVSEALFAVAGVIMFKRGKWKGVVV